MESPIHDMLSLECSRPRYFRLDQWYDRSDLVAAESQISYRPNKHDNELLRTQKGNRRLRQWWHKPTESSCFAAPSGHKLAEAKTQRFTTEGKGERISKSLAALHEPSHIRLTPDEWRRIVEDPDLEDQS
jgi:hypothetical protein